MDRPYSSAWAATEARIASTAALALAAELGRVPSELIERTVRLPHLFSATAQARSRGSFDRMVESSNRTRQVFERMHELDEELEHAQPLARRLTHLLDHVSFGLAMTVSEKLIEEGPDAMIELLADVLLSEEALDLFEVAAREGRVRKTVKIDLLHAIDHLREGDYLLAAPTFATGVEGAIRDAVPPGGRRPANARSAARKAVPDGPLQELFGEVFDEANEVRHGEDADRRKACILLSVALLIWVEASFEASAVKWLGSHLDHRLRQGEPQAA